MPLEQFEHLLAAAAEVTGQDEFVVVGSQAILGTFDEPLDSMLQSMEADIYPKRAPDAADLIDGNLGDGSQFHAAFGYYAHGVGPETAKAPRGWQERLVRRVIPARAGADRTAVVWCLEIHDLVLSKLVAGREPTRTTPPTRTRRDSFGPRSCSHVCQSCPRRMSSAPISIRSCTGWSISPESRSADRCSV